MASILSGRINLSKIPQDLIKRNNAGEAFVWVDVAERREPSQYGDTHNVSIYDSANRQKIYIGELRPRELGGTSDGTRPSAFPASGTAPAPAPAPAPAVPNYKPMSGADENDLPF